MYQMLSGMLFPFLSSYKKTMNFHFPTIYVIFILVMNMLEWVHWLTVFVLEIHESISVVAKIQQLEFLGVGCLRMPSISKLG